MKLSYKYIEFYQDVIGDTNKESSWRCCNKTRGGSAEDLGKIYYDKQWKQFVWEQESGVIFSGSCLKSVIAFLYQLNNG